MIVRIVESRSVATHRAWRRASSLGAPVVAVAPDTRRRVALVAEQLAAMGLDTEELRNRRGGTERTERWWRAWTSGICIERIVLVNPQLAHPEALCAYLLTLQDLVAEVVLLERPGRTDGYEAIMAELVAVSGPALEPPSVARPSEPSPVGPAVPRTGTPTFLAAVQRCLPLEAATAVLHRYDEVLVQARDVLATADPTDLLQFVWATGAASSIEDDLLVALHAIRVASWSSDVEVRFDPHVVLQRAGKALLAAGDERLWERVTGQVDANRAATQALGVLGWSVEEILELSVDEGGVMLGDATLPRAVQRLLRVVMAARRADGGDGDDRLVADPTRDTLDERTVGHWIRLATTDHLAPTVGNHLRRRRRDPVEHLRDLGLEWADA